MSKDEPDLVASMDQAGAEMEGIGKVESQYFRTLIIGGFERAEAMELVKNWQESRLFPEYKPEDD